VACVTGGVREETGAEAASGRRVLVSRCQRKRGNSTHLTDKLEFYQLLDYTDDVDLRKKLIVWEEFYNVHRPHGGLGGKTPYEVLREKIAS